MDMIKLGRKIRLVRTSKQLTQENVAYDLKCSINTYTKIERGETNVPFLRLVQIADYFNVDLADLVRDTDEPNIKEIANDISDIKKDIEAIKFILNK